MGATSPDLTPAYIARKSCGCLVEATVDIPEHLTRTARKVARWKREGLTVERMTVGEARPLIKKCPHEVPSWPT